jgi:hypothetical protein
MTKRIYHLTHLASGRPARLEVTRYKNGRVKGWVFYDGIHLADSSTEPSVLIDLFKGYKHGQEVKI